MPALIKDLDKEKNPMVIIGGFADRDFSNQTLRLADKRISLAEDQLPAWTPLGMVLYNLEKE